MFTGQSARGAQIRAGVGVATGDVILGALLWSGGVSGGTSWVVAGIYTAAGTTFAMTRTNRNFIAGKMYIEFHFSHDNGWHTSTTTPVFDKNGNEINSWSTGCEVHGPNG